MDSGSTQRYLLYAIGEILLVVIGILIALQINNWNQSRLNSIEEQRLLRAIGNKMELNRMQYNRGMSTHESVIQAADDLLRIINKQDINSSNTIIEKCLHNLTIRRFLFGMSNSTHIYDELIGSGQLSLLSNPDLQKKLTEIKVQLVLLESYEALQNNFVDREMSPFLNDHVDRVKIYLESSKTDSSFVDLQTELVDPNMDIISEPTSYKQLLENRKFSNLLLDLLKHTKRLLPVYNRIEDHISDIESILSETTQSN